MSEPIQFDQSGEGVGQQAATRFEEWRRRANSSNFFWFFSFSFPKSSPKGGTPLHVYQK